MAGLMCLSLATKEYWPHDISETAEEANNVISIILSDLSEKQVSEEDFSL